MENEEIQKSDIQSSESPQQNISEKPTRTTSQRKASQGKPVNKKKLVWIVIVIIAVLGLAAGGYYILKEPEFKGEDVINNGELSAPEYEEPTKIPTPTQEPVEREGVSMQILNGTGIEGEASYLQGKLRNLGYEEIEVANAKNQENEEAQVTFSDDLSSEVVDELTDYLKDVYEDIDFDTSSSTEYDVEILTGLRSGQTLPTPQPTEAEEPTPTASPSATPTD